MEQRWIEASPYQIKLLNEFSCTELIGIVYAYRLTSAKLVALTKNEIHEKKEFEIGGHRWKVLYTRPESDDRGPYLATALGMV